METDTVTDKIQMRRIGCELAASMIIRKTLDRFFVDCRPAFGPCRSALLLLCRVRDKTAETNSGSTKVEEAVTALSSLLGRWRTRATELLLLVDHEVDFYPMVANSEQHHAMQSLTTPDVRLLAACLCKRMEQSCPPRITLVLRHDAAELRKECPPG